MTPISASPEERMASTNSRWSSLSSPSSRTSARPSTPLSGVRISWLMLATYSDFRRDSSSASSRALASSAASRRRSPMSWTCTMTCPGAPRRSRTSDTDRSTQFSPPDFVRQRFSSWQCGTSPATRPLTAATSDSTSLRDRMSWKVVASSSSAGQPRISHSAVLTFSQAPSRPTSAIPIGASANAVANWDRASSRSTSVCRRAASAAHRSVMSRDDDERSGDLAAVRRAAVRTGCETRRTPSTASLSSSLQVPARASRRCGSYSANDVLREDVIGRAADQ